jgi:Icc protein
MDDAKIRFLIALPPPAINLGPTQQSGVVSWVHFGDLHITTAEERNYRDFEQLISEVNLHLFHDIDFCYLPGDNADHGTEEEYRLIRMAIDRLQIPIYIAAGDHDVHSGSQELLRRYLVPEPFFHIVIGHYSFVFLNAFEGGNPKVFDLSSTQISWLRAKLRYASAYGFSTILFLHCYPSELEESGPAVRDLILQHAVLLVEMGHTHYNEIANDGYTLYVATRSIGQIEEGPVGFSITNLDGGVVSWKFNAMGNWPLATITSPADRRMIIDPEDAQQVLSGEIELHVKVWSAQEIVSVTYSVDGGQSPKSMNRLGQTALWCALLDSSEFADGEHIILVEAWTDSGARCEDQISVLVNQSGYYVSPKRQPGDDSNAIGAWPEKGILGTQLGPNKNGRKW